MEGSCIVLQLDDDIQFIYLRQVRDTSSRYRTIPISTFILGTAHAYTIKTGIVLDGQNPLSKGVFFLVYHKQSVLKCPRPLAELRRMEALEILWGQIPGLLLL